MPNKQQDSSTIQNLSVDSNKSQDDTSLSPNITGNASTQASVFEKELLIQNNKGLHARAAAAFVKCVENFNAEIQVQRLGQSVSGSSIMGLMMLAASKGTAIKVRASGLEAEKALDAVSLLVNCKFGEE